MALSPDDLLPSVYLCLNRIAPAYEGLELGVAETSLIKAIAQATGRTMVQIKADAKESGDLGIVAEHSRSNQRMIFQPARLTVKGVFDKLKEIAKMTGHASQSKKVCILYSKTVYRLCDKLFWGVHAIISKTFHPTHFLVLFYNSNTTISNTCFCNWKFSRKFLEFYSVYFRILNGKVFGEF